MRPSTPNIKLLGTKYFNFFLRSKKSITTGYLLKIGLPQGLRKIEYDKKGEALEKTMIKVIN